MVSKLRLVFSISILFLSFYGYSQRDYWKQESAQTYLKASISNRFNVKKASVFSFDDTVFKRQFKLGREGKSKTITVGFPNEKGELIDYAIKETPVFSKALADKYPNISSYTGYSLKNGEDKIRVSVSHKGIQAMIIHADKTGNTYIQKTTGNDYIVYSREGISDMDTSFVCETKSSVIQSMPSLTAKQVDDQKLRKFRLAISATGEYTTFHGGTVADALAAINATVTRINEVFESDLGVTLELVADTDKVIYTDGDTDPYGSDLNSEAQSTITDSIGAANFDIGHLFHKVENSDQNGGNAGYIGAVCVDNKKASGYSSKENPEGDTYDLDYVAHEMGHQFGANHTWSFESEGTQVQVEPGSGTTIMGYAGISGVNNVAMNGDDYFHYYSIFQISEYLDTVDCAETINITNTPPVIVPVADYVIPKSTPFVLTGNATDADVGDVLTYTWEQIDDGVVTQSTFGPTNPSGANFRSQKPSTEPTRYFPKLSSVLSGDLTETSPTVDSSWETLSEVEREMNFALTVRDNAVGGGQVVFDLMKVSVVDHAGPFRVVSQATSQIYTAGTVQNIVWDVAGTNMAPVNVQSVDILLSIDGGLTFTIPLAEDVPNDGDHKVVLPGTPTTTARIMVKARDNIFFAVNKTDFTIEEAEIVLNFTELEYEVCQPNDLITTFNYETHLGFDEEVTFSVQNPPLGLDITFSPETTSVDTLVTVTFSNTASVPEALYDVEIEASSTSVTKSIILDLRVYDDVFPDATLLAPADGAIDISAKTFLEWEDAASYTSYEVQIATDLLFTDIIETSTVLENTYSPLNLDYETDYYWRVKPINSCGEGSFSAPFGFSTIEYNCTSVVAAKDLEISSIDTPTVTSKIAFYDDMALADINVHVELDHTYLADLVVKLISPAGTSVVLLSNSCGDLQNINATFDDDAPNFICNGDPAISGTIKPIGSLGTFIGESLFGEWTLEINDTAASDGGVLKAFSLDVCIEGAFRPDDDQDGVFDDGDDLCLGTPIGAEVDINGCPVYRFPSNNFTVSLQSEACRDSNDGAIAITALETLDYDISVRGNGVDVNDDFTDSFTLGNLMAGTYNVCIGGTDGLQQYEEYCFEVVITQPDDLFVSSKTSYENELTVLTLQGSDNYTVELNGEVLQTKASEITLELQKGNNSLKVYTDLPCQGVYEEAIFLSAKPVVYPNPFVSSTTVFLGTSDTNVRVEVFTVDGRFVWAETHRFNGSEVPLDLSTLPSGVYIVKFSGEHIKGTSKVIKL
ncbi:proprotein convertase P-domain-containing protein [Maribacter polysiphoniae]|uniref:Proprotein convertase P-domain-containing protein n=1 Tax=Maribacter polysiphoniae TaxID=429344 RepID=A0A316EIN5_9FLAO|nr:zinc-dependent metalloprotease family protein [Maribacter polysiphoniae]MBD1261465.1 proprotein convertase P-domain-containing protein [Maribacter polysiphoniae]PWK22800.1 putative secreted protein (Por secretion system target) [Maribacter polysiphoniae]